MKIESKQITTFQKEILDWYKKNKRDLPWRQDQDPYKILVSEVMLQQTQVQRVIPKFEAWKKTFPDIESLAKASNRDVLLHWSGLGYNRRALYLKACAEKLVNEYEGKIPQAEKKLVKLPGVGKYTARAILCFAFDKQIVVVDTNIKKVILVKLLKKQTASDKEIEKIAQRLLPQGRAYEWNQALMDYASAMLKSHKIAIPKQSKFKDSDRYYRGQILKFLLAYHAASLTQLSNHFSEKQTPIEEKRLRRIISSLIKDKFLIEKDSIFALK